MCRLVGGIGTPTRSLGPHGMRFGLWRGSENFSLPLQRSTLGRHLALHASLSTTTVTPRPRAKARRESGEARVFPMRNTSRTPTAQPPSPWVSRTSKTAKGENSDAGGKRGFRSRTRRNVFCLVETGCGRSVSVRKRSWQSSSPCKRPCHDLLLFNMTRS